MDTVKSKKSIAIICVAASLLIAAVAVVCSIYGYRHSVRSARYELCLADDAFAKAWFNGELTPTAEGHNEPVDGVYIAGEYTTYYFGTGADVSYVTQYTDSDMVLVYNSGSDHIRQYDGEELTLLGVGEYQQGRHTFEIYPMGEAKN